jgi:hypothetical protein
MDLTELSYQVRRTLPFVVLGIIIFFIFFTIFKIATIYTPTSQISLSPTPTPAFGLLTSPKIFDSTRPKTPIDKEYFIDTISGVPETATSSAIIAFVPRKPADFSFREKALLIAKKLDFDEKNTQTRLSDKMFTVVDREKRLEYEIDTANYTYTHEISAENEAFFASSSIPTEDVLKTKALDLMRSLDRYPKEIAQSTQTVTYFSFDRQSDGENKQVAELVTNPQSANMVEVNFFPPKYNGYESVTSGYFTSPNYIVFVPQANGKNFIVRAQVKMYEPSEESTSLYPIKTGDEAYADILSGEATLIAGEIQNISKINIKKMFMAYLYPDIYSEYLMPVYVFVGDNGFVAYSQAVSANWVSK